MELVVMHAPIESGNSLGLPPGDKRAASYKNISAQTNSPSVSAIWLICCSLPAAPKSTARGHTRSRNRYVGLPFDCPAVLLAPGLDFGLDGIR